MFPFSLSLRYDINNYYAVYFIPLFGKDYCNAYVKLVLPKKNYLAWHTDIHSIQYIVHVTHYFIMYSIDDVVFMSIYAVNQYQVALVVCGFFICDFAYMRLKLWHLPMLIGLITFEYVLKYVMCKNKINQKNLKYTLICNTERLMHFAICESPTGNRSSSKLLSECYRTTSYCP